MAPATSNVAPRTTDSSAVQSHGTSVSSPSAIDATNPAGAASAVPRSVAVEHCDNDTLHSPDSSAANQLPTPPDFLAEVRTKRAANVASVLQQVANNDFDEQTYQRLQRFAHEHQMTVEQVRLALSATPAFARFFAGDPTKQYIHERLSFEYMVALALHPSSAIAAAHRLPQKGANMMVITSDGVLHGDDVGRRKQRGRPIDINAFVSGWSVYQFHKYTFEEGGAQRNAFADVETWVDAAKRFGSETGPLHRSMDPFELYRPALYVAVVDGPFWNADARSHIAKVGKAVTTPTPGAVMVCSTAELNDLYSAIDAMSV